jgi:hypothetical protein
MMILGLGGFLLPLMGLQFKLLLLLGDSTPYVAAGLAVLGGILLGVSHRQGQGQGQVGGEKSAG